jgi:TatD DNase family protein
MFLFQRKSQVQLSALLLQHESCNITGMIFDTHCHGYWKGLAHREEEVLRNMHAVGVMRSVQIGTDLESSRQVVDLARRWGSDTWCAVGLHPADCQRFPVNSIEESMVNLEKLVLANRDKIVGVGETGLDYFHLTSNNREAQKEIQQSFFRAHAALALRLDLPLIVHTGNAGEDTLSLIKSAGICRAIIHCFSEGLQFAEDLLAWSDEIYFSFSGILTYKNAAAVQHAARSIRLDRILVETDAPFLVPQAVRGKFDTNESAFVRHVLDYLKSLRDEPSDIVEQTVWENSNRVFRIKK